MTGGNVEAAGAADVPAPAIELREISKSYGAVKANDGISLFVEAGTIHGIVGENGAGKSTLMKILYGMIGADSGEIHVNGEVVSLRSSADAISCGIGMVHQHFMLVKNFSVLENVMLGSEGGAHLSEGKTATLKTLHDLATDYGMTVDPDAIVSDLPVGVRQRVEIIKALKGGKRILILDEPTGVLTPEEADKLFEILTVLKERGVTILLITHKLKEIMAITDAVSIMRNGQMVGHRKTAETNPEELAELMVGRKVLLRVERGEAHRGEKRLSVAGLGCEDANGSRRLSDVQFDLHSGEILGVAGVAGNGQSELLEILTGMRAPSNGDITVLNYVISPETAINPRGMREIGVGHIPEDRHHYGLVLDFEAYENTVLGYHLGDETGEGRLIDRRRALQHCKDLMVQFDVRPQNPQLRARSFSGGNQQKLVIAREMHATPKLLIVGQPTRGVDIGAIEFIHKQLITLRDQGCAILLVSVELDEILGLSDRIMVMNEGRNMGIVDREEASEQKLGLMMSGISAEEVA